MLGPAVGLWLRGGAVITCPKCSKENQDHYKFCLGCGAELPRDASPKKFAPGTPPQGVPAARSNYAEESTAIGPIARVAPVAAAAAAATPAPAAAYVPPAIDDVGMAEPARPAAAAQASAGSVVCPQCQEPNPTTNKFCALCGFKLT